MILSGDEQFADFYDATRRALRSYVCRVAANEAIADDIIQESYVRLLSAPPMLPAQCKSYLYRIATNLITDHQRSEARRRQRWWPWFSATEPATDMKLDLSSDMHQLLALVSVSERSLLWLAYVERAEHREIAEILNVKEKSVKVLLYRARRKMESILKEHGFEGTDG